MGTNSCVPFRGRGPRSGEGVLEGKNRKDTLKWSRPPIGGPENSGVPHRCLASYTLWPLKGQRGWAARNLCVILFLYHSGGSPFGGWRHHLSPYSGGTMGAGHFSQFARGVAAKEKPYNRVFGPWKCTPFGACGTTSPGGGSLLSARPMFS